MNNIIEKKHNRIEVSDCKCGGGYILYTVYYNNKEVCTVHEYEGQYKKHIAEFILQQFIENFEKFGKNELTKNNDIERRINDLECEVSKLIYVNRDKLRSAYENECVCNHSKKERIDLIDRRPAI